MDLVAALSETERRRAVKRLQATKFVRSVGQGALVVAFALYLKEMGWSAPAIGLMLTIGGLATAGLSLIVGYISDRLGRKGFLLGFEILALIGSIILLFTGHPGWIAAISLTIGIGRNQGGFPAAAGPAEQAWMAAVVPRNERGIVYSYNSALGFFGMGLGSVFAGLIPLWAAWLPGTLAYRPLFALGALGALVNFILLWQTPGGGRSADPTVAASERSFGAGPSGAEDDRAIRREENGIMIKMAFVNALNGVAVGLTSPLLSYWFNVRFGVGPESLGPVFAVTFFATGLASIWTGRLTERMGIVRAVVTVRLSAVILLVITPLLPWFWLASVVHVLRSALTRGSVGARQALAVSLVRSERRGVASSLNNISMNLPNSLGPSIAGSLMDAGHLSVPFYLAAGMQFLYGVLYSALFQRYDTDPAPGRGTLPSSARSSAG